MFRLRCEVILLSALCSLLCLKPARAATGWTDLGPQTNLDQNNPCVANNWNGISFAFHDYCPYIIDAWGGGAWDDQRQLLYLNGGGHVATIDDSVLALDPIHNTLTKLWGPAPDVSTALVQETPSGQPPSAHIYGAMLYFPRSQKLWRYGASGEYGGGNAFNFVFEMDMSNPSAGWTAIPSAINEGGGAVSGWFCVVDPTTSDETAVCTFPFGSYNFARWDRQTSSWTNLCTDCVTYSDYNGNPVTGAAALGTPVMDPTTQRIWYFSGNIFMYDTKTTNTAAVEATPQTSGCSTILGPGAYGFPGAEWDPAVNKIRVYTSSGNVVTTFDPVSLTCTDQTYLAGPGADPSVGSFGNGIGSRFRYAPSLGAFVLAPGASLNGYTLTISTGITPPGGVNVTAGDGQATVRWNTFSDAKSYNLYWIATSGDPRTSGKKVAGLMTSPYTLPNLTNGVTYLLSLTSVDDSGNESAAESSVLSVVPASSQTNPTPVSGPINGLGHSFITDAGACLDKDGDRYGVGPACKGPDADDTDPTVHTGAQAIAAHGGTLNSFLAYLGYSPNRIWYLAPAAASPGCNPALGSCVGNDATGVVNDPNHPYLTYYPAIYTQVAAGDAVILRDGWNGNLTPPSGTAGHPIIVMSYPGELAVIDPGATPPGAFGIDLNTSWVIVDGLKTINAADINSGGLQNDTFRHIETTGAGSQGLGGIAAFNGLVNLTIEENVFHDTGSGDNQHCMYLGSREVPSNNVIIRRNICYNASTNGFHFNGRMLGSQIYQNIIYSVGVAGMSFQNGTANSTISNNLIFNAASSGFELTDYDSGECSLIPGETGGICPYDENYNTFENNTVYQTAFDATSGGAFANGLGVNVSNVLTNMGDMGHNTFRNNIFVTLSGYQPIVYRNANQNFLATSIFANNIYWAAYSQTASADPFALGLNQTPGGNGFQGYSCAQAAALTTLSGCMTVDPQLTQANPSYWSAPSQFNFLLSSTSQAIGAGTSVGAPAYDIRGAPRPNPPSLGAYDTGTIGAPLPDQPGTPVTVASGTPLLVRVYPNPWRSDKHNGHPITFAGLVTGTTIKIFTVSGHKVKQASSNGPTWDWDRNNDSGDKVASGIYIYLVTDSAGDKVKGKVAVIK